MKEIEINMNNNIAPSVRYGINFALLTDNNVICTYFISCQSYISDLYRGVFRQTWEGTMTFPMGYSLTQDHKVSLDKYRLCVAMKEAKHAKKAQRLLRMFERHGGIVSLSQLFSVKENPNLYVFESSSEWMASPFTISLYSLLVRISESSIINAAKSHFVSSCEKFLEKPDISSNSTSYLRSTLKYLFNVLPNRNEISYQKYNNFPNHTYASFHGYGIVSLCTAYVKEEELKQFCYDVIMKVR